jgi:predicted amidohydrolase YtcJ
MKADLALINGQIISMDTQKNEYEGVAIKNGRIICMGSTQEIHGVIGEDTEIVDLNGKTVLPGFIDAHQHMLYLGFNLSYVNCNKESIDDLVNAIKERASVSNPTDWIIGIGFNEVKFKEKRLPRAEDFADIPNPIFIMRYCLHTAVVNQVSLSLAGINQTTLEPMGGEIIKDRHGTVTGVLREKAVELVKKVMPSYTRQEMKKALTLANNHYVSEGITAVHEAGMGFFTDSMDEFRVFQEMTFDESIQVRIYGMVLDKFFPIFKEAGLLMGFGNAKLKIGPMKMFSDGTLNGRTASVTEAYLDPAGTRGMMVLTKEELEEKVLQAHKEGYQISIHAIGDHAINQVITAYEKALTQYPRNDHRHRIEHCSVTTPLIIQRMKNLDLIPVLQPGILHIAGDVYRKVLKPHVLKGVYPIKTFFQEGICVAGSSDAPVVPSSPMFGMYVAMTRQTGENETIVPEQQISLYQAIKMYTVNAAFASFSEKDQGTLETGKLGDLVVLPQNFMSFSPEEVRDVKVEMTVIGGKVVFENNKIKKEVVAKK